MSITSCPGSGPSAAPRSPKSTSSTCGASGTQVITTVAGGGDRRGSAASFAPSATSRSSASRRRWARDGHRKSGAQQRADHRLAHRAETEKSKRGDAHPSPPRCFYRRLSRSWPKRARHEHCNTCRPAPDVRSIESLDGQAHASAPLDVRTRTGKRHADDSADRSGPRTRPDRFLRQSRIDRHRLDLPACRRGKLLGHRAAHRPGREVSQALRRPRSAGAQDQRQNQRASRRRSVLAR